MIRYIDSESGEYTQCDGSGEDWTDSDCFYYLSSMADHLNYLNLYESCAADDVAGGGPDPEPEGGIIDFSDWSPAATLAVFVALGMGWVFAALFSCCWVRERRETTKQCTNRGPKVSYRAFNDTF